MTVRRTKATGHCHRNPPRTRTLGASCAFDRLAHADCGTMIALWPRPAYAIRNWCCGLIQELVTGCTTFVSILSPGTPVGQAP